MWSDRPSAAARAATRSLLSDWIPDPGDGQPLGRIPLGMPCAATELAEALHNETGFVWLDGADQGRTLFALDPVAVLAAHGSSTTLCHASEETRLPIDAFGALEVLFDLLPTGTRLFGYLGYELAALLEELPEFPAADARVPDLHMGVYDAWLEGGDGQWVLTGSAVEDRMVAMRGRIEALLRQSRRSAGRGRRHAPTLFMDDVSSVPDGPGFEAAVRRTLERIGAGEIFETNLCRRFSAPWSLTDAWELYRRLRAASPAEYGAYLRLPDAAVLSISPECFLRLRGRAVESRPIKGTRGRSDPQQDAAVVAELRGSEKDTAELAMIVDLVRNDLGRVSVPGSVVVSQFAAPMILPTVIHTVAQVTARLRPEVGPADLLRATFPPGSITGAPKIQAMKVSAAEEPLRRGPAMGAIGWIDAAGDLEMSVAIRTAVVTTDRVDYHAGGGIVADSDPLAEREETMAKARAFLQALGVG